MTGKRICGKKKVMADWFDPSDDSRLIISPQGYVRDRGLAESAAIGGDVVMFFTGAAVPHLVETRAVKEYPFRLPGFLGNPSLYGLEDARQIVLVEPAYGAPAAVCCLETAIALGCRRLLVFGQCGGVGRGVEVGDLVLPAEAVREEGSSFHYMADRKNARPDPELLADLRTYLRRSSGLTVHEGKTVSTDAPFRQTLKRERRWRDEGILGVDMEMSALLTVTRYHGIPAVGLLVVSDKHDLDGATPWTWGGDDMRARRLRAIDLMVEFAVSIQ